MADFDGFPKDTLAFLRELSEVENNNKPWFDDNRKRYTEVFAEPAKQFVTAVGAKLQDEIDPSIRAVPSSQGGSIFRINRDVRFSTDKRPYKDHLDLWFWVGGDKKKGCPGLGWRLKHDALGTGGGLMGMDKDQLAAFRQWVLSEDRGPELADVLQAAEDAGLEITGQDYKRVPRGFDPDHARAELLRFKGVWAFAETDVPDAVHSDEIVELTAERFRPAWPLVRWMGALIASTKA